MIATNEAREELARIVGLIDERAAELDHATIDGLLISRVELLAIWGADLTPYAGLGRTLPAGAWAAWLATEQLDALAACWCLSEGEREGVIFARRVARLRFTDLLLDPGRHRTVGDLEPRSGNALPGQTRLLGGVGEAPIHQLRDAADARENQDRLATDAGGGSCGGGGVTDEGSGRDAGGKGWPSALIAVVVRLVALIGVALTGAWLGR